MNEQGNYLDARNDISEKYYFSNFSYKSLASGALILRSIVIADNNLSTCVKDFIIKLYHIFPNAYNTKIFRDTH